MPKYKATAKWIENVRSVVDNSRTHSIVCDLSTPAGGNDKGPTAIELALMALADCAVTIFADVCKQSKIEIIKVEAVAEAEKISRLSHIDRSDREDQSMCECEERTAGGCLAEN